MAEWQTLTQLYREMGDQELYELHAKLDDLTEMAQQVLRDEMQLRGLKTLSPLNPQPKLIERLPLPHTDCRCDSPNPEESEDDSEEPHEYTWKTVLCECNEREEAWQIQETLRQAGIESWIESSGYRVALDTSNPRIQVAADQLEQAREVISRPIPQAIVEQSKMDVPEFVPPVCPQCGDEDPVLESADPINSWLCENCGKEWQDPVETLSES